MYQTVRHKILSPMATGVLNFFERTILCSYSQIYKLCYSSSRLTSYADSVLRSGNGPQS